MMPSTLDRPASLDGRLDAPLLDLGSGFPDEVYVVCHAPTSRYGCFCHEGVHGLACFSTAPDAERFARWIELSGLYIVPMAFDAAREVAKDRPMPVVSLMLLDDLARPLIHYVR